MDFVIGLLLGVALTFSLVSFLRVGTYVIYFTPEEGVWATPELTTSVDALCERKWALFRIDVRQLDSQE